MWVQGPNNTVPPPEQWSLPAVNWVVEAWVMPVGTGATLNRTDAQFLSTGSGQFGGTPGGVAFRTKFIPESSPEEDPDTVIPEHILVRLDAIGPSAANNFTIGTPAVLSRTQWTHVAAVNDNGTVTFYVNGVPSVPPATGVTPPSGVPYIGSGQDTGQPFNGYLDEIRFSTFAPGAFKVEDLLLRPLTPNILAQPRSATVWEGGTGVFEVEVAAADGTTFQWKTGGANIDGATGPELLLPAVTAADNGKTYLAEITNENGTVTTEEVTLTVAPKKTEDVNHYRAAVQGDAGLVAYFPVDGSTGATLGNLKNPALTGEVEDVSSYESRVDRSYGERSLRFKRRAPKAVTAPANAAFDFSGGTGTIEALVYLESSPTTGRATILAAADGPDVVYWKIQASLDGSTLYYDNDALEQPLGWSVTTASLKDRIAHVAFTFGDGKVTAYVDGVSLGSKEHPSFGYLTGLPLWIGSSGKNYDDEILEPWNGTIDEVAIYNTELSENTIAAHNSRFLYGVSVPPPVITSQTSGALNLLAGGAPVLRVQASGAAPLTYQWKLNGNPVTNNPTATTPTLTLNNTTAAMSGEYTVTVSNEAGQTTGEPVTVNFAAPPDTYAGYVLADNPSAYWRLNEAAGPVMKDYAGGLDGAYSSTVNFGADGAPNVGDKAIALAGQGDPVPNAKVPYSPVLNPSGPFTLEFWAKPDQSGNIGRAAIGNQNRNTGRAGYAVYQGFNVNAWEAHLGYGENVLFIYGQTPPEAGRWDHVVVTWDGVSTARIWVNGVDDTHADSTVGGPHRPNLSVPLEIGSRFGDGIPFPGTIDEVAFYNYALTPEQIRKHWSISWRTASITQQPPAELTAPETGTIVIPVAVDGYPNTYQWYRNGVALEAVNNPDGTPHYPGGVNGPTLEISQSTAGDAGDYQLVVSNPQGDLTTTTVKVSVTPDVTPPEVVYVTADASLRRVRVGFNRWVDPVTAGNIANYTFSGGLTATDVVFTEDPAVVNVITTPQTPGMTYTLSVTGVRDQRANGNLIAPNSASFSAYSLTQGVLAVDFYYKIPGTSVEDMRATDGFPDNVYHGATLTSFSTSPITNGNLAQNPEYAAMGLGDNYGTRVYGWITPEVGGEYRFFLRSDDGSELYLSTDENPANMELIAFEDGCCKAFLEPADNVSQTSHPVALEAGKRYYIEAFQKEGGGGDYVEVAWRLEGDATPAGELQPIPGRFLSAYATLPITGLQTPVVVNGQVILTWGGEGKLQESDDLQNWRDVPGNPSSPYATPAEGRKFYRLVLPE